MAEGEGYFPMKQRLSMVRLIWDIVRSKIVPLRQALDRLSALAGQKS